MKSVLVFNQATVHFTRIYSWMMEVTSDYVLDKIEACLLFEIYIKTTQERQEIAVFFKLGVFI